MKKHIRRSGFLLLAAMALLTAGCIISGTFVVTLFIGRNDFSTTNNIYYYAVDLTEESTWEDHKDDIENIDVIGFEAWITNNSGVATDFDIWIDDIGEPRYTTQVDIEANATHVLTGLSVPAGAASHFISYGESLGHITNVATLKTLAESGAFHYYGYSSTGGPSAQFVLDSARVIVTLTASNN